ELGHGDELRAERTEGVEALRAEPLALRVLDVARGDVVCAPVAAHMVQRGTLRDPPAAAPDLDAQLGLGIDVRSLGGQHDRIARADQRVLELAEEERSRRRL